MENNLSIDPPAPSKTNNASFISQYQENPPAKTIKPTGAGILTDPYIVAIKEFMSSMIQAGYVYDSEVELFLMAKAMVDQLIKSGGYHL